MDELITSKKEGRARYDGSQKLPEVKKVEPRRRKKQ